MTDTPRTPNDGAEPSRAECCPTCQMGWWLNPPAKISGSNAFRCVGCKAVYTGEQRAAPDMLAALEAITKLEPIPFVFPADWQEQIEGCPECRRYKDHPIQNGICDQHRKPIYAGRQHDDHQQRTLIYRAQDIARAAKARGDSQ